METEQLQPEGKHPARILSKRTSIFFFLTTLIAFFFWLVGNFRGFLDSTQLMLLAAMRLSSIALTLCALIGLGVFLAIGAEKRRLSQGIRASVSALVGYSILLAVGVALTMLSEILTILSGGIG